jgi:hypothetical protein
MRNKIIFLIFMAFLAGDITVVQAAPAVQSTEAPPANMNDTALASYISGRLKSVLKDTGYVVSQDCDDSSGCAVVVQ